MYTDVHSLLRTCSSSATTPRVRYLLLSHSGEGQSHHDPWSCGNECNCMTSVQLPHEPILWYHFMDGRYSNTYLAIYYHISTSIICSFISNYRRTNCPTQNHCIHGVRQWMEGTFDSGMIGSAQSAHWVTCFGKQHLIWLCKSTA